MQDSKSPVDDEAGADYSGTFNVEITDDIFDLPIIKGFPSGEVTIRPATSDANGVRTISLRDITVEFPQLVADFQQGRTEDHTIELKLEVTSDIDRLATYAAGDPVLELERDIRIWQISDASVDEQGRSIVTSYTRTIIVTSDNSINSPNIVAFDRKSGTVTLPIVSIRVDDSFEGVSGDNLNISLSAKESSPVSPTSSSNIVSRFSVTTPENYDGANEIAFIEPSNILTEGNNNNIPFSFSSFDVLTRGVTALNISNYIGFDYNRVFEDVLLGGLPSNIASQDRARLTGADVYFPELNACASTESDVKVACDIVANIGDRQLTIDNPVITLNGCVDAVCSATSTSSRVSYPYSIQRQDDNVVYDSFRIKGVPNATYGGSYILGSSLLSGLEIIIRDDDILERLGNARFGTSNGGIEIVNAAAELSIPTVSCVRDVSHLIGDVSLLPTNGVAVSLYSGEAKVSFNGITDTLADCPLISGTRYNANLYLSITAVSVGSSREFIDSPSTFSFTDVGITSSNGFLYLDAPNHPAIRHINLTGSDSTSRAILAPSGDGSADNPYVVLHAGQLSIDDGTRYTEGKLSIAVDDSDFLSVGHNENISLDIDITTSSENSMSSLISVAKNPLDDAEAGTERVNFLVTLDFNNNDFLINQRSDMKLRVTDKYGNQDSRYVHLIYQGQPQFTSQEHNFRISAAQAKAGVILDNLVAESQNIQGERKAYYYLNLSGGDAASFSIDSDNGVLTIASDLTANTYNFRAFAKDKELQYNNSADFGYSVPVEVIVTAGGTEALASSPLIFSNTPYSYSIRASQSAPNFMVGEVSLKNPPESFRYFIDGTGDDNSTVSSSLFAIDSGTGNITMRRAITSGIYRFKVTAFVPNTLNLASTFVEVRVIDDNVDINDNDGDGIVNSYDNAPNTAGIIGRGTSDRPYIITNVYQLQAVAGVDHEGTQLVQSRFTDNNWLYGNSGAILSFNHYALANNIDASVTSNWLRHNSIVGFTPITDFSGVFDGAGYEISSLSIGISSRDSRKGLFATNSGTITSLGVSEAHIMSSPSSDRTGILVGLNTDSGIISYSYTGGFVNLLGGRVENIGGLVGENQGQILYSYSYARIGTGNSVINNVGGLVGVNSEEGAIVSSYSAGEIYLDTSVLTPADLNFGGLIGSYTGGEITSSYSAGKQYGKSGSRDTLTFSIEDVGGAFSKGDVVKGASNYWDVTLTSDSSSNSNITGLSSSSLKGCGLDGKALTRASAISGNEELNSQQLVFCPSGEDVIYPAMYWGEQFDKQSRIKRGWIFNPHNSHPSLFAFDANNNRNLLPAAAIQHCHREVGSCRNINQGGTITLPPIFTQEEYTLYISSSANIGTQVGIIPTIATDTLQISYSLLGSGSSIFSINNAGVITLASSLNPGAQNIYQFFVMVNTPGIESNSIATVFVNVVDDSIISNILTEVESLQNDDDDDDGIVNLYDSAVMTDGVAGLGTQESPYIIKNIYQLQAIAGVDHKGVSLSLSPYSGYKLIYGNSSSSSLTRHYRLVPEGSYIDASATRYWNLAAQIGGSILTSGFTPIGSDSQNPFNGSLTGGAIDGDAEGAAPPAEIRGLYINRPDDDSIGVIGYADNDFQIANIRLTDVDIRGGSDVGAIAGSYARGSLSNIEVTGKIVGDNQVGGLVGYLQKGAYIMNSNARVSVRGKAQVGGLVGRVNGFGMGGFIDNSYAAGDVSSQGSNVGGLVGDINRMISIVDSYATGNVRGSTATGGLVGRAISVQSMARTYATGNVVGGNETGGLLGIAQGSGSLLVSYASGDVQGLQRVGGLVGEAVFRDGIVASYSNGDVVGMRGEVGGLVGIAGTQNVPTPIIASYAGGDVNGLSNVGGLLGKHNNGSVSFSYAVGDVISSAVGATNVGRLIGNAANGNGIDIETSYHAGDLSITAANIGLVGSSGGGYEITDSYYDNLSASDEIVLSDTSNQRTTQQLQSCALGDVSLSVIEESNLDTRNRNREQRQSSPQNAGTLGGISCASVFPTDGWSKQEFYSLGDGLVAGKQTDEGFSIADEVPNIRMEYGWNFAPNNAYPTLFARDLSTGESFLPAIIEQACLRNKSLCQDAIAGDNTPPKFILDRYSFPFYTRAIANTPVGRVTAVDDEANEFEYRIIVVGEADNLPFHLDANNGEIVYTGYPITEENYEFSVIARELQSNLLGIATVSIALTDVVISAADTDSDGIADIYDNAPDTMGITGNGTSDNPYEINNIYQLQAIGGVDHTNTPLTYSSWSGENFIFGNNLEESLNAHYKLAGDINAEVTRKWNINSDSGNSITYRGFIPIGQGNCIIEERTDEIINRSICSNPASVTNNALFTDEDLYTGYRGLFNFNKEALAFNGVLNGLGYKIENLYINRFAAPFYTDGFASEEGTALFGYIGERAHIIGLGIENAEINGLFSTGALVGVQDGGTITQSYVADSLIIGRNDKFDFKPEVMRIGGLTGMTRGGSISYSYAANITLAGYMGESLVEEGFEAVVGGLTGMQLGGALSSNYASTNIEASHDIPFVNLDAPFIAGGLVGYHHRGSLIASYAITTTNISYVSTYAISTPPHPAIPPTRTLAIPSIPVNTTQELVIHLIGERSSKALNANQIANIYWNSNVANDVVGIYDSPEFRQAGILPNILPGVVGLSTTQLQSCGLNGAPIREGINCNIDSALGGGGSINEGGFVATTPIFPEGDWSKVSSNQAIIYSGWSFAPAGGYPTLFAINQDKSSYLPSSYEQHCHIDNNACTNNGNAPPQFEKSFYEFVLNPGDKLGNSLVGSVLAIDYEGDAFNYSIAVPADVNFNIDKKADGQEEGEITTATFLRPGNYLLTVVATEEKSGLASSVVVGVVIPTLNDQSIRALYEGIQGGGTARNPYLIGNIYQLQAIAGVDHEGTELSQSRFTNRRWLYGTSGANQLTKHYRLTNNIDAFPTTTWNFELGEASGFTSIGDCSVGISLCPVPNSNFGPFSGEFDGNSFRINSLHVYPVNRDAIGLFGVINGASIKDLTIDDVFSYGGYDNYYIGGLAGYIKNSEVSSVRVTGDIDGWTSVGALAGFSENSIIENSEVSANVIGWNFVGGAIGYLFSGRAQNIETSGELQHLGIRGGGLAGRSDGVIASSTSRMRVIGVEDSDNTGGLVGLNNEGDIINSSSYGAVDGWFETGGLVGSSYKGSIVKSYSESDVSALSRTGGIAGYLHETDIFYSGVQANIKGATSVGGLIGFALDPNIIGSYANASITGTNNVGGLLGEMNGGTVDTSFAAGEIKFAGDTGAVGVGGLVGQISNTNIIRSYSNIKYVDVDLATKIGLFVGIAKGNNSIAASYTSVLHPSVTATIGENVDDLGVINVTHSYHLLSFDIANRQNSGFTGYRTRELQGCGLDGLSLNPLAECDNANTPIYPSQYWSSVSAGGVTEMGWRFSPSNAYPQLFVREFATGRNLLPTSAEQLCLANPDACSGNLPPEFSSPHYTFNINPATANINDLVGAVAAIDRDNDELVFSIAPVVDATDVPFNISSETGEIFVKGDISSQEIIYSFNVIVQENNLGKFDIASVTVNLISTVSINDSDSDGVVDGYDSSPGVSGVAGKGTAIEPYLINNIYQLQAIAGVDHEGVSLDKSSFTGDQWLYGTNAANQLTKHYRLTKNIDASTTATWNYEFQEASGFTPIGDCSIDIPLCNAPQGNLGPFTGAFDGAGFEVSSLYINPVVRDAVGMFGAIRGGAISNLNLIDIYVFGGCKDIRTYGCNDYYTGGLTGHLTESTVNSVQVTGNIDGWTGVGGLVGLSATSNIINSKINVNVIGWNFVGGGVGYFFSGEMRNMKGSGRVQQFGIKGGGLAGQSNGFIDSSIYQGDIIGDEGDHTTGGLVGHNRGEIVNSKAYTRVTGKFVTGGLVGFNADGRIDNSQSYSDISGPLVTGGLAGADSVGIIINSASYSNVSGTDAIGGLVGQAEFSDISFANAKSVVTGVNNIGGLVGVSEGADIVSSYSEAEVIGISSIGGLVGGAVGSDISFSYSTANIATPMIDGNPNSFGIGGLVGVSVNTDVSYSSAQGIISASDSSRVGGLIGNSYNNTMISYSSYSGNVTGDTKVGGLVGRFADGDIIASHTESGVLGRSSVGGLAGELNTTSVFLSYSTGVVAGSDKQIGGLVGKMSRGTISDSWALNNIVNAASLGLDSVGGLVGEISDFTIRRSYVRGATPSINNPVNSGTLLGKVGTGSISGSYTALSLSESGEEGIDTPFVGGTVDVESSYFLFTEIDTSYIEAGLLSQEQKNIQGCSLDGTALPTPVMGTNCRASFSTAIYPSAQWGSATRNGVSTRWDFGSSTEYPRLLAEVDGQLLEDLTPRLGEISCLDNLDSCFNNSPPQFLSDEYNFIVENAFSRVGQVSAIDAEGDNFIFSIAGDTTGIPFVIDATSGVISFVADTISLNELYTFAVRVKEQGSSKFDIAVVTAQVNSRPSDFDSDGIDDLYDDLVGDGFVVGNGSEDAPYVINNIYQLQAIAGVDHLGVPLGSSPFTGGMWLYGVNKSSQLSSNYVLGDNIEAEITRKWKGDIQQGTGAFSGFIPIGDCGVHNVCVNSVDGVNTSKPFVGTLNGGGYQIGGLYINRSSSPQPVGLFGYVEEGAIIKGVGLINASVVGWNRTAAIAGLQGGGSIIQSYVVSSDIHLSDSPGLQSKILSGGGLVGALAGGNIRNSYAADILIEMEIIDFRVRPAPPLETAGGLVGTQQGGNINSSYAIGRINLVNPVPTSRIGGLVGYQSGGAIEASYAAITPSWVEGVSPMIGGIVGDYLSLNVLGSYWVNNLPNAAVSSSGSGTTQDIPLRDRQLRGCSPGSGCEVVVFPGVNVFSLPNWQEDWVFEPDSEYPALKGVAEDASRVLPSAAIQYCHRNPSCN